MVEVLKTGLFDSIQDLGRSGYQEFGVPYSGAMDQYSAVLSNSILGNDYNAAVIESTAIGPKLKFHKDTKISITGAFMKPKLNGESVQNNTAVKVIAGDVLELGQVVYGFRTYIAVLGGFQTETVMKSRSMYVNITSNFKLIKGDKLPIVDRLDKVESSLSAIKINQNHFATTILEAYKGPEFNDLNSKQQYVLFNHEFCITKNSNRMAYRLEQRILNKIPPIITSLVLPGTIQLTPSGEMLILMRDAQTTGGYPRILQLSEKGIDMLAQKSLGANFRIKCII